MKHKHIILILLSLVLFIVSACEINQLNSAEDHYKNQRYAAAIQELDNYIQTAENGALITRSEILRSQCYYELGLKAIQVENWDLSIKFLKLANSEEADKVLANVYKTLADKALEEGNLELSFNLVNAILREIPQSELTPEMLSRRISFLLDTFIDYEQAWQDYKILYNNYPNNVYEVAARKQIAKIVPSRMDYARRLYTAGYYSDALNILFELQQYPVGDQQTINQLICEAYMGQAENSLNQQKYLEAERLFRIAIQYDPSKRVEIEKRIEQMASLFVQKGDEYVRQRDYDNALIHYQKAFEIIPEYSPAKQAIARLNTIKENVARANELSLQAEKAELAGKYDEALKLYRQANNLDSRPEFTTKITQMQNLLEAQADPVAFTKRIINQYKGGIINTRIQKQKQELLKMFDPSEVYDSGWKIMITSNPLKYEARYDLITPTVSYYYVWLVNLRDRSIVPLNKLSEKTME